MFWAGKVQRHSETMQNGIQSFVHHLKNQKNDALEMLSSHVSALCNLAAAREIFVRKKTFGRHLENLRIPARFRAPLGNYTK